MLGKIILGLSEMKAKLNFIGIILAPTMPLAHFLLRDPPNFFTFVPLLLLPLNFMCFIRANVEGSK